MMVGIDVDATTRYDKTSTPDNILFKSSGRLLDDFATFLDILANALHGIAG
jgi:hypothetical protein